MEIRIAHPPLALYLEVFETDDQVPSMHAKVQIVVSQFQHTCRYEGTFWIECVSWDSFTDALRAASRQEAVLRDISGYFLLALRKINESMLLVWEFTKTDVSGERRMRIEFSSEIDDDALGKIKKEFLDFPVWWQ